MLPNNTANFWNKQFSTLELASELAPKDKVILERSLDFFGDVRGKEVLDIGCGLGGSAIPLAALGANVTAVDVSATAVERLNQYAKETGLGIHGHVLDAFRVAELGQFDFAVGHIEPFDEFVMCFQRR